MERLALFIKAEPGHGATVAWVRAQQRGVPWRKNKTASDNTSSTLEDTDRSIGLRRRLGAND
jgi:hypothetical protein